VHGSEEEADAAKQPPRWSQLLAIVWRTMQKPLLWFLTLASLLHGACVLLRVCLLARMVVCAGLAAFASNRTAHHLS
jgi:hypothetical protein